MEAKNKSDFEPALISKKDAEFASNASILHFTLPRLANDTEESPDEATLSLESGRTNGAESLAETVTETGNGTSSTIPDAVNSRPETPNEQTSSEANVLINIDSTDHPTTPGNSHPTPSLVEFPNVADTPRPCGSPPKPGMAPFHSHWKKSCFHQVKVKTIQGRYRFVRKELRQGALYPTCYSPNQKVSITHCD